MTLDSTEIFRGSSTSSSQKINTSAMLLEDEVLFMDKFNNTITDCSSKKTIVELFEEQVLKTPGDPALNEVPVDHKTMLLHPNAQEFAWVLLNA